LITPHHTTPTTIFDSSEEEGMDDGFRCAIARDPATGNIVSVAFMDEMEGDLVEMSPRMALRMAREVIAKVRDPDATLN